ncbi:hypothetical protein [Hydrogenivirga sp.]
MKQAKRVRVPSGWWVVYPLKDLPIEYVAFYVFAGLREGVKPMLTQDYIVFGVFERQADAEFLAKKLSLKDVNAEVMWREAEEGILGMELRTVYVEPRFGVDGVLYHVNKAIEKAQDIDPSVLNRDLLLRDLKLIRGELEKWKAGRKGYSPAVVESSVEVRAKEKAKKETEGVIKDFLNRASEEDKRAIIRRFLRGK